MTRWKFDPAKKDGESVEVEIAVGADFHLIDRNPK
jgi:hypothetical protein